MEEVIKLPVTVEKPTPKKKKRVIKPRYNAANELIKRQKNVQILTVLGEEDASVRLLEDLVFGAEEELVQRLGEDKQGASLLDDDEEGSDREDAEVESDSHLQPPPAKKAAWVDEDDEREEEVDMSHRFRKYLTKGDAESKMTKQKFQQRMTEQFQKSMGGKPSWAEVKVKKSKKKGVDSDDEEREEDDDDDLLRKTGNFVAASESLPSGTIEAKKCRHANGERSCSTQLTTVQFHPSAQVIMTAGLDHSVSLFQVDGKTNPKIQSIHLDRFPVHKAQFTRDGSSVVATGKNNKMFYMYDMMEGRVVPVFSIRGLKHASVREFSVSPEGDSLLLSGNDGYLHVLKLKTKEVVQSLKINGSVSGVAFSPDGGNVFAQSEEGEVYVWDMRSSRCVNKFMDEGCVKGTSIAASQNGQYLACGSQSGVVNVYSQQDCLTSASPGPLKTLMNLVTPVTSLAFNPVTEILAMASASEDEALRLVHLPSLTVFSNFPLSTKKKYFNRTNCIDFSPHSGFLSLASNKGAAQLMRLLHYKDF